MLSLGWANKLFLRVMGCQHRSLNWAVARSVVCVSELLDLGCRAAIVWGLSPQANFAPFELYFSALLRCGIDPWWFCHGVIM